MSTSREVDNLRSETMGSVNSILAIVTEEEILKVSLYIYANTIILSNLGKLWLLECSPPCVASLP